MKYTITIFILITAVAFAACDKTRTCPAFDDSTLHKWFPYETGVTYNFLSSDGRQEIFTITQEDYSTEHQVDDPVWGKETFCEIHGERETANDTVVQDRIPLRLRHVIETDIGNATPYGISMTFRTMDRPIILSDGDDKLALGRGNGVYTVENFDVWEVNGRNYRGITDITVTDDEAAKIGMDKIYIARDAGIIGYRTYPGGREYWQE